ncbi:MAG: hypothetical protein R2712_24585 [Vicinamibacterales bacterium]
MRRAAALLALFAALTLFHTWPLAADITGLSRLDNDDTGLNVWIVAWVEHILPRNPLALFDAPMFYPEPHTLAYSEHLLVPALIGAPLRAAGVSPVTTYNVLALLGLCLSGWTMSLVVQRWTGSTAGGVMAGMLFAFNAHLLTRFAHLQALHAEFYPLALYAFDRVLGLGAWGVGPGASGRSASSASSAASTPSAASATSAASVSSAAPLWLSSAFILQSLCSNYALAFLAVALVAAAIVRAPEWVGPGRGIRLRALLLAGIISVAVMAPFLWPYYEVSRSVGLVRSVDEVRQYSAGWLDYLTTGGRLHYTLWSHRVFEGRTALFPGITAVALAILGLLRGRPVGDPRLRMTLAIGAVGLALSFGPALPGYAWLHDHVPLLQGIRGAARWGFLLLLAVAILAGYGTAALARSWRGSPYLPALLLALYAAVTLEAMRTPMGFAPVEPVAPIYAQLADVPGAVLVELPMFAGRAVSENARYLVNATV